MPTIMELFKAKQNPLSGHVDEYGLQGTIYIESRGLVAVPRAAALLAASPDPTAGLIGSTAAGLIGGRAERPSDTIFKKDDWYSKPISLLAPTQALLQDSVKEGPYFVKMNPSPALLGTLSDVKNTVTNAGAAQSAAISALNKYGSRGAFNRWLDSIKQPVNNAGTYSTQYMPTINPAGKPENTKEDTLYTDYYYDGKAFIKRVNTKGGTKSLKRKIKDKKVFDESVNDIFNRSLILSDVTADDSLTAKKIIEKNKTQTNSPFVMFKVMGDTNDSRTFMFPATITGLAEEFIPNINSFKYIYVVRSENACICICNTYIM